MGAALVVYGVVGVAVLLRLLPLFVGGLASWLGLPGPLAAPAGLGLLAPLQAHYDGVPWLPWAAWLVGVGLLFVSRQPSVGSRQQGTGSEQYGRGMPRPYGWLLSAFALIVLLLVGCYARMVEIWPQGVGLSQFPYDDEGVYAGASQLFIQGILPYRDYFFAHPPVAAIAYAPAMVYHFTQWGSPTSFMIARYLSVGYSLVTLGLIFFIGRQLAGLVGGIISGALWALDGRVVEINRKVMLDGPMVLLSCGALALYLWVRPTLAGQPGAGQSTPRRPVLVLALAGLLAGLSALTKIAGVACLLAILADLLWVHLDNRRLRTSLAPLRPQLLGLLGGALLAALVSAGPFLVAAPSQFIREVLFFQILRPSDGVIDVPARIADLSATFANPLTLLFAATGFATVSFILWRASSGDGVGDARYAYLPPWRPVVLWTLFSLLLFTYSRSFYSHYYIQLAAPLCLMGSGVSFLVRLPAWRKQEAGGGQQAAVGRGSRQWLVPAAGLLLLAVVVVPLMAVEWNEVNTRHEDRIFEIVSRYVSDAVHPGTPVLTTDEQFNFLAARPPSRNATGYLIDSYGHMIFLGLGLGTRDWGDLIGASLRGEHGNDAYAVMQSPAPQADILDRAFSVPLVVVHQKGLARLTAATVAAIEARSRVAEQQARYIIYRVTNSGASR
ncbi:MAG: glycosyltransferase family 39 protein [Chloroflexia bacterium]